MRLSNHLARGKNAQHFSAWLEDSIDFRKHLVEVLDVFEDLIVDDEIEEAIREAEHSVADFLHESSEQALLLDRLTRTSASVENIGSIHIQAALAARENDF